jgi:hypothetical protein
VLDQIHCKIVVRFIDGSVVCDMVFLTPSMKQMIVDVAKGKITHVGDRL